MIVTHKGIIISVMHSLGGDSKTVDLETLTVSCFKIFPSKFSMDRFLEYPRFDRVQKRVSEIEKDGFIRKTQEVHYMLTLKGIQWIKDNSHIIDLINKQINKYNVNLEETLNYNITDNECRVVFKKLKKSETYIKYKIGKKDNISIMDFLNFMKVDIYAKRELFDRKVKRIKSICLRDNELKEIFEFLEDKYTVDYNRFNNEIKKLSKVPV